MDLEDHSSISGAVNGSKGLISLFGRIDVLINNAGIACLSKVMHKPYIEGGPHLAFLSTQLYLLVNVKSGAETVELSTQLFSGWVIRRVLPCIGLPDREGIVS